jgi:hypothetical protein
VDGSGAIEPGVPGATEPALEVASTVDRFCLFSSLASSYSLSASATPRRAATISFVYVTAVVGVLTPLDVGVGNLEVPEEVPFTVSWEYANSLKNVKLTLLDCCSRTSSTLLP